MQHQGRGIRTPGHDIADDAQPRDAGDIREHEGQLEVHQHEGFLHVGRASPRSARACPDAADRCAGHSWSSDYSARPTWPVPDRGAPGRALALPSSGRVTSASATASWSVADSFTEQSPPCRAVNERDHAGRLLRPDVGHHTAGSRGNLRAMGVFLYRWPNGDCSVVLARTKADAVEKLDEVANAEGCR
jgi:hypothetical protein